MYSQLRSQGCRDKNEWMSACQTLAEAGQGREYRVSCEPPMAVVRSVILLQALVVLACSKLRPCSVLSAKRNTGQALRAVPTATWICSRTCLRANQIAATIRICKRFGLAMI